MPPHWGCWSDELSDDRKGRLHRPFWKVRCPFLGTYYPWRWECGSWFPSNIGRVPRVYWTYWFFEGLLNSSFRSPQDTCATGIDQPPPGRPSSRPGEACHWWCLYISLSFPALVVLLLRTSIVHWALSAFSFILPPAIAITGSSPVISRQPVFFHVPPTTGGNPLPTCTLL